MTTNSIRVMPITSTQTKTDTTDMTIEQLRAELDLAHMQNDFLRQSRGPRLSMKVSDKGGLSVYGLGRFPVTLYKEQWEKLLAQADAIKAFIEANKSVLAVKPVA